MRLPSSDVPLGAPEFTRAWQSPACSLQRGRAPAAGPLSRVQRKGRAARAAPQLVATSGCCLEGGREFRIGEGLGSPGGQWSEALIFPALRFVFFGCARNAMAAAFSPPLVDSWASAQPKAAQKQ